MEVEDGGMDGGQRGRRRRKMKRRSHTEQRERRICDDEEEKKKERGKKKKVKDTARGELREATWGRSIGRAGIEGRAGPRRAQSAHVAQNARSLSETHT